LNQDFCSLLDRSSLMVSLGAFSGDYSSSSA
jgi:hypothetical protein